MDAPTHKFHSWLYNAWNYEQSWRKRAERNESYFDGDQWTSDEEVVLEERGQQATVMNLCRPVVDQISALYLNRRSDIRIIGREIDDDVTADLLTELMKQINDQSDHQYYEGMFFREGIIAGRGWQQIDVEEDENGEFQIYNHHVPWNEVYCDPYFRKPDASDARYIIRQVWMDLDYAKERFGEKADGLDSMTTAEHDAYEGIEASVQTVAPSQMYYDDKTRRVAIYECWYMDSKKNLRYVVFSGATFLVGGEEDSSNDPPIKLNVIPLVPYIGSRNRKGEPQGVIDWIAPIQDSLNKLYSKWQWNIMSRQAVFDADAIDDPDAVREELARPDGVIVTAPGYFERFQVLRNTEESAHIASMMSFLVNMAQRVSGVNDATLGIGGVNARSGEQENMRMIQGAQMQSQMLENLYFSKKRAAVITLKLIGAYYTNERTVRITQPNGMAEYFKLNSEYKSASGEIVFYDISDVMRYDVVIKNVPEFTTVRQYTLRAIVEAAKSGAIPIQIASRVILELADIPGKERLIRELEQYQQQEQQMQQQMQAGDVG